MPEEHTEPSASSAPAGDIDVPPTVVATTTISVNRRLGRGGIGDVYTASDRATGRSLAVKFLNDWALEQESFREAFAFEATVTSQLEHPNIVPVYVTGATPDGKPFYAMRLIPGRTLAAAIAEFHDRRHAGESVERRSARYSELLGQFALVCKAIAYAHDRGVIHRDIKPANIMLGRFGEVVVLDWGLAARIDRDDKARSSGEQSIVMPTLAVDSEPAAKRGISGTPAYMSPEQHDGARHVGPESDVYGLGATLYHILTGQPPFEGDLAAIREKALAGAVPPPSRVKRGVSRAIEAVCLKAMARDPVDRYDTPLELARDVEHYLADLPVSSYREPLPRRLARWARRHRTVAQLATAALVLLLLTAGTAAVFLKRMAGDEYRARQTALLMAARLAASTAALQIDSRWRILEHEAGDRNLVTALAAAVQTPPAEGRQRGQGIQAALDAIAAANRDAVDAESWTVCDAKGVQVARWPPADTIGKSFAYRDYFHGRGGDLPPGTPAEPLRAVHRSTVYTSAANGKLQVAFSAPIWSGPPSEPDRSCLGVLVMAFDVGLLFRSIESIGGWNAARKAFSVAVIDLRDDQVDGEPKAGLVLENPDLDRTDVGGPTAAQIARAPAAIVERLRQAVARGPGSPGGADPFALSFDSEVPTIAAAEPIVILGRPRNLANVDWAVIVHER
ncbi:MAG: serine/threonine protein kinase [Planctomycetia bacterium]|nr:serine/threonine protein kinase [Planctomycetia bacterium]